MTEEKRNKQRAGHARGVGGLTTSFPDADPERRAAAGRRLLAAPPMPVPSDWMDLKRDSRESLCGDP